MFKEALVEEVLPLHILPVQHEKGAHVSSMLWYV